jgi:hypothetical protein
VCIQPPNTQPPSCIGAMCQPGSCSPGFGNCDLNLGNGCEANLNSDPSNCGACGVVCGVGDGCVAGVCQ